MSMLSYRYQMALPRIRYRDLDFEFKKIEYNDDWLIWFEVLTNQVARGGGNGVTNEGNNFSVSDRRYDMIRIVLVDTNIENFFILSLDEIFDRLEAEEVLDNLKFLNEATYE